MTILFIIIGCLSVVIGLLTRTVKERQKECDLREKEVTELRGRLEQILKQQQAIIQKETKKPIDIRVSRIIPHDRRMHVDERLREDMAREIFVEASHYIEFVAIDNPVLMETNVYARLRILSDTN